MPVTLVVMFPVVVPVAIFLMCKASGAKSALCIIPSGKPPADIPVNVPDPFNVIALIYTIVTVSPAPIVRVTPLFIVIGPAAMAFRPSVIV